MGKREGSSGLVEELMYGQAGRWAEEVGGRMEREGERESGRQGWRTGVQRENYNLEAILSETHANVMTRRYINADSW